MKLPKNILSGTAEPPEFYLCQANKDIIGGLNVIEPQGTFKFNSYSEISFQVSRLYQHPVTGEMIVNPLYDYVEALRVIYVVDFGYFQIQEAKIASNGIFEYKDVVAYSLEYELTQKYLDLFTINYGTVESIDGVKLYNAADISHSLIHLVLDKMNGAWQVGSVDESLQDLQRSFEVDHQSIYDFMMNDMADTFKCVFEFDTENKVVNIYEEDKAGKETNIYIAMDTIANEVNIEYSADDIKTCLYVYGEDDISIREVNLGFEYITNIDYYNTPEWLGQDLYDAYNAYCKFTESCREEFSELMLQWSEVYDELSELYNKIPHYEEDEMPTVESTAKLPKASEEYVYDVYKVGTESSYQYYICKATRVDDTTVYNWELDVDGITSFYVLPTPSIEYVGSVYKVYNQDASNGVLYYICESYKKADNTFGYKWRLASNKYGINLLKEKEQCYLDVQEVKVSAGHASMDKETSEYKNYEENYEKLLEVQRELKELQLEADELSDQLDSITADMNEISNRIKIEEHLTHEQIIDLNSFIREDEYSDDCFVITELDDDQDAMDVRQELMEAAQKELMKISQPQLSFSMTMANLLAIPEFEPVINDFECGNYVAIEIRPDYVVKTQILEVDINFDDLSDFSVTFGNLSSLYSQVDIHSALMAQAVTAGKSVASSGSYWKKGADQANAVSNQIKKGLINAQTVIKSENQAVSWDSHGIHLRKYADESKSTYEDDQIWMNNEKIVFTDNNWRTAKMAVGKIFDPNLKDDTNPLGEAYGIIAPNIVGTLLAGENLVIDSTKGDGSISSFRVDHKGARLYNSNFLLEKEITYEDENGNDHTKYGQIMIDPRYGIVAGNGIYLTNNAGEPIPTFLDQDKNVQKDEQGFPLSSNFFLDIDSGNAYFRGYVYAMGGYFNGTISSATVESATGTFTGNITAETGDIGGWKVKDGILWSTGEGTSISNFVGLSSKYNLDGTTSNYAIWAGSDDPQYAPFAVQRDGTVKMTKGQVTCELNVGNNFIVDPSGNVTMSGSINLAGNITWSRPPIMYQYSSDNADWHDSQLEDDIYRRESLDGGVSWGTGYQFIGSNGTDGSDGQDGSDANVTYANIMAELYKASEIETAYLTATEAGIPNLYSANIVGGKITGAEIYGGLFSDLAKTAKLELSIKSAIGDIVGETHNNPSLDLKTYDGKKYIFTVEHETAYDRTSMFMNENMVLDVGYEKNLFVVRPHGARWDFGGEFGGPAISSIGAEGQWSFANADYVSDVKATGNWDFTQATSVLGLGVCRFG